MFSKWNFKIDLPCGIMTNFHENNANRIMKVERIVLNLCCYFYSKVSGNMFFWIKKNFLRKIADIILFSVKYIWMVAWPCGSVSYNCLISSDCSDTVLVCSVNSCHFPYKVVKLLFGVGYSFKVHCSFLDCGVLDCMAHQFVSILRIKMFHSLKLLVQAVHSGVYPLVSVSGFLEK